MDKQSFIDMFIKYGFEITRGDGIQERNFDIQDIFNIFDTYGENVNDFECIEIHKMSPAEYEEFLSLENSELASESRLKCSGINTNGKRCGNIQHNSLFASSTREFYEILKDKWYCAQHEYQDEDLVRAATTAIYKEKK